MSPSPQKLSTATNDVSFSNLISNFQHDWFPALTACIPLYSGDDHHSDHLWQHNHVHRVFEEHPLSDPASA